jgi:hypothetical protein
MEIKLRQETPVVVDREHLIQHALEDMRGRQASIVSVLTIGQERMRMKINFYQWLAVRRWEGMEKEKGSGWKTWRKGAMEKNRDEGVRNVFEIVKDAVMCF